MWIIYARVTRFGIPDIILMTRCVDKRCKAGTDRGRSKRLFNEYQWSTENSGILSVEIRTHSRGSSTSSKYGRHGAVMRVVR